MKILTFVTPTHQPTLKSKTCFKFFCTKKCNMKPDPPSHMIFATVNIYFQLTLEDSGTPNAITTGQFIKLSSIIIVIIMIIIIMIIIITITKICRYTINDEECGVGFCTLCEVCSLSSGEFQENTQGVFSILGIA